MGGVCSRGVLRRLRLRQPFTVYACVLCTMASLLVSFFMIGFLNKTNYLDFFTGIIRSSVIPQPPSLPIPSAIPPRMKLLPVCSKFPGRYPNASRSMKTIRRLGVVAVFLSRRLDAGNDGRNGFKDSRGEIQGS